MSKSGDHQPVVPASQSLPELTIPVLILGVVLSIVLGAANTYLGLFAGMTVSASIPAAVIAMAALKPLKGNILQNNAVQTAASAGESLAAGIIFTMPALVMMDAWDTFNYLETTLIAVFGGFLGVLFTIPLRRALITGGELQFPEGVATAEVLKVGQSGKGGIKLIGIGAAIGSLFKFGSGSGLALWHETAAAAANFKGAIWYAGTNLSPALVGVGYIVKLNIAIVVVMGGVLNWYIVIPLLSELADKEAIAIKLAEIHRTTPDAFSSQALAGEIWSGKTAINGTGTRFLGVGAMLVGGLFAVIKLRDSLVSGIKTSLEAYKNKDNGAEVPRTERDTPMNLVLISSLLMLIPLFFLFHYFTDRIGISILMSFFVLVFGFLFSAVAAYMAGLVGSSHNPISGVTICTILLSALIMFLMKMDAQAGPVAAILIGAVVCCAAALGGDNMQDLKAGHLVGSTPFKLQIMQLLGVLAAAMVLAPILNMLHEAYVIGSSKLSAPQGTLMSYVAKGPYEGLPWTLVFIGAIFAVMAILIDKVLEQSNATFRVPVLALAVGIYLPLELTVPILIGGILHSLITRKSTDEQKGLLLAAGIITGEALLGILLAVPIAITKQKDFFSMGDSLKGLHQTVSPQLIGLVLLTVVCYFFYKVCTKTNE